MQFLRLVLPVVLLAFALPAMAAPLAFVEPPDLTPNLAIPDHLGPLDLGTNSVAGTLTANFLPSEFGCFPFIPDDDADAFSFQVPAGLVVTNIQLVITDYTSPAGWNARFRTFSGGTSDGGFSGNMIYPNIIIGTGLGAGIHDLQVYLSPRENENGSCPGGSQSLSYEFTFTVESAVPVIPTTWGSIKARHRS